MVFLICVPIIILYIFAARPLVGFFMDDGSEEAINTGIQFLHIVAPFYFVVAAKLASDGILRGSLRMSQFMVSTFSDLILRVLLAFLLSKPFGSVGIWSAWPLGWFVAAAFSVYFCVQGGRMKKVNTAT